MRDKYKHILIVKMSSLGDIIHALPTLSVLRKTFPDAKITWAVHPAFAGLLPGKPWIDEVYYVDRKKIKNFSYLRQVRKDLHSRHFDLVIDLQMIAKSALIAALSGGKMKVGYWDGREGSFLVSKPLKGPHWKGHIIEQLLDTAAALGGDTSHFSFPIRDHEKEKAAMQEKLNAAGVDGPYAVLVPGTRGERKKWPIAYWGELAQGLLKAGTAVVISGAPGEEAMGQAIAEAAPGAIDLVGKTSLLELAALDEMAALHISCDTGPLHIANAMGTPLIALFGPTLPDRSGPFGNPQADVLLADHPGKPDTDMATISVQSVLDLSLRKLRDRNNQGK